MATNIASPLSKIDVHLEATAGPLLKYTSQGSFASRELYQLRLQAEHALLVSGFVDSSSDARNGK